MTQVYGEQSLNGLILIKTKSFKEKAKKSYSDSKILFLVDGQVISQEEIEKIDPKDIETVTVIKNEEDILKYTTEHYDGVILIEMKK